MTGKKLASNRYVIAALESYIISHYGDAKLQCIGLCSSRRKINHRLIQCFQDTKGDLNVCSPNYQYNITVCQMVMKDGELSTSVKEVTKQYSR